MNVDYVSMNCGLKNYVRRDSCGAFDVISLSFFFNSISSHNLFITFYYTVFSITMNSNNKSCVLKYVCVLLKVCDWNGGASFGYGGEDRRNSIRIFIW